MGLPFDRTPEGKISQRRFGGHTSNFGEKPVRRACHAADRTGHMILQTLYQQCIKNNVNFFDEYHVVDLIMNNGAVAGVVAINIDKGNLQRAVFDPEPLAEITSPDFPNERLIACYNAALAEERRDKRQRLLAATEVYLKRLAAEVQRRTQKPLSAAEVGMKAGKVIGRHKMAKHFQLQIADGSFVWQRDATSIRQEEELDGIYVIRTSEPAGDLGTADCVPVLVADVKNRTVAAFHAGWRGTVARIVENGIAKMMQDYGSQPQDLIAQVRIETNHIEASSRRKPGSILPATH